MIHQIDYQRIGQTETQYTFIDNTSAFVLEAVVDIEAGSELTVDYGPEWFGDCCPCLDCHSALQSPAGRALDHTNRQSAPAMSSMQSRFAVLRKRKLETNQLPSDSNTPQGTEADQRKKQKKARRQRIKRTQSRRVGTDGVGTVSEDIRLV
jgi:hypothetical protein